MRTLALSLLLCLAAMDAHGELPGLSAGYTAFYNLDFDRAIALFERETETNPASPEAWNHLAHGILHRRLYLSGAMASDLIGSSNAFLRRPRIEMPAAEEKRFLDALQRSLELSNRRLAVRKDDPVALYALGVAHAHRGKYHLLVRKARFDALRDANRSRGFHNRLRKTEPENPDALLIPGMHEYIASHLSPLVRLMAAMAGFSGNRERGIALIEEAARGGRKTAVEARLLLALTYNREKQPERALPLMRELSTAFPRNYLYRSEVLLLHARAGQREEALAGLAQLEAEKENSAPEPHLRNLRQTIERLLGDGTRS
jgi:tetratricopeptide (TPR) repeat protein